MNHQSDEPLSRSQRKRDAEDIFTLASDLVDSTPAQLERLPLTASLLDSIQHIKSISSRIARKRETQYLAKLLRSSDHQAIADKLEDLSHSQVSVSQEQHIIEQWRDALIAHGTPALNALMGTHRAIDRKHYLSLIRQSRVDPESPEAAAPSEPVTRARKKLYQMLKELHNENELPAVNAEHWQ